MLRRFRGGSCREVQVLLACFATVVGLGSPNPAQAETAGSHQEVTFTYAPPDGTKLVESVVTTRDKTLEGIERQVDVTESRVSVVIRRVDEGFLATVTPISLKFSRNGEARSDIVSDVLKDVVVTYRIGADGRLTKIEGYQGLVDNVQKSAPPEDFTAVTQALSEQALVARDTAEWNGRTGDYAGASVTVGETIASEAPFALPNGETITIHNVVSFPRREPCPAGSCLRVVVQYASDAKALTELESDVSSDLSKLIEAKPRPPRPSESRISGEASWLIDPQTMLLYAQTVSRTIGMTIQMPDHGPIPTTIKEERRYSFEYQ